MVRVFKSPIRERNRLVEELAPAIRREAQRQLRAWSGPRLDIDDVVQDACVRAVETIDAKLAVGKDPKLRVRFLVARTTQAVAERVYGQAAVARPREICFTDLDEETREAVYELLY